MTEEYDVVPLLWNFDLTKNIGLVSIKKEYANIIIDLMKNNCTLGLGGSFQVKSEQDMKLLALSLTPVPHVSEQNKKFHDLLDAAIRQTQPGESFLPKFTELLTKDFKGL